MPAFGVESKGNFSGCDQKIQRNPFSYLKSTLREACFGYYLTSIAFLCGISSLGSCPHFIFPVVQRIISKGGPKDQRGYYKIRIAMAW